MFDGSATTQIVTNDSDETKRRFSFELRLAKIASFNNTYVIAFMDCCRNQVKNYYFERIIVLELLLEGKLEELEAEYPKDLIKRTKEYLGDLYNEPSLKSNTELRMNSELV